MSTIRRIYRNMLFLSGAEIISKILQFILMVYAARLLDKASFGKFSFALSLSFIAIILADLGIFTLFIREVARNKNIKNKYFVNSAVIKLLLAFMTSIFIAIYLNALGYPEETKQVVYIIWAFAILSTFTQLFYAVFRAFESMFFDSLIKVIRMVLLTMLGLYFLFNGYGVIAFSFSFVIVEVIVLVLAYLIAKKKFLKIRWLIDFKSIREIIKKALPFGLSLAFSSIYFYIGSVILSKIRGDVEVAIYSVAYNLALAILFIPEVYSNVIYPVMSRYYKTSNENLILMYKKSFKYLYIIGLPISAGLYFLADRVIVFFYGREYISSIIALQIISWFLFIKFINTLMGYSLASINRQDKRMLSQGSTAVFNIALNLILIPKMGYTGAAIATFITEIFLFILYYWYISKFLYAYNFLPILIKPLIAAAFMVAFIKYAEISLILLIPLSAIVYFAVIFLLKTFEKDDYGILRKIFKISS